MYVISTLVTYSKEWSMMELLLMLEIMYVTGMARGKPSWPNMGGYNRVCLENEVIEGVDRSITSCNKPNSRKRNWSLCNDTINHE